MAERVAASPAEEAVLGLTGAVQAAGGVVVRPIGGRAEVALVHRPRYDDWSLPKGKLVEGESHEEAALREVSEETGLACRLGLELPSSEYDTDDGAHKVVRYWAMVPPADGELRPTGEVDGARWLPIADAAAELTHERDREVLAALATRAAPAYLLRHAKAGSRRDWHDADELRPLSTSGRRQAKAVVHAFDGRRVGRILSSPAVRCVDTVRPLAAARSREIEPWNELGEGRPVEGARALLNEISTTPVVFSLHGDLVPLLVEEAEEAGAVIDGARGWKKASIWILEREAGVVVRMRYVPPPDVDPSSSKPARRRRRPRTRGPGRSS